MAAIAVAVAVGSSLLHRDPGGDDLAARPVDAVDDTQSGARRFDFLARPEGESGVPRIEGRVIDEFDRPLIGARVAEFATLEDPMARSEVRTDGEGRFELSVPTEAHVRIRVESEGHRAEESLARAGVPVEIRLMRELPRGEDGVFVVEVCDASGTPVTGAVVRASPNVSQRYPTFMSTVHRVERLRGREMRSAVTDSDGRVRFAREELDDEIGLLASGTSGTAFAVAHPDAGGARLTLRESVEVACDIRVSGRTAGRTELVIEYASAGRAARFAMSIDAGDETLWLAAGAAAVLVETDTSIRWEGEVAFSRPRNEFALDLDAARRIRIELEGVAAEDLGAPAALLFSPFRRVGEYRRFRFGESPLVKVPGHATRAVVALDSRRYRLPGEVKTWGQSVEVALPAAPDEVLRLDVVPAPSVEGVVVRAEDGLPVPGVDVVAFPSSGLSMGYETESCRGRATTDDAGRFRFEGLAMGRSFFMVDSEEWTQFADMGGDLPQGPGRLSWLHSTDLREPGMKAELRIEVQRPATLRVRVADSKDELFPSFFVSRLSRDDTLRRLAAVHLPETIRAWRGRDEKGFPLPGAPAEDGVATIEGIAPGRGVPFQLEYRDPVSREMRTTRFEVDLPPGAVVEHDIDLARLVLSRLIVEVLVDGAPAPPGVQIRVNGEGGLLRQGGTGSDGRVVFAELPADDYRVEFADPGAGKTWVDADPALARRVAVFGGEARIRRSRVTGRMVEFGVDLAGRRLDPGKTVARLEYEGPLADLHRERGSFARASFGKGALRFEVFVPAAHRVRCSELVVMTGEPHGEMTRTVLPVLPQPAWIVEGAVFTLER
ncbi:MAG: carboxypeptidase-like regulatory domain-containing protein [Planctomycetota bacterium]